MATNLARWAVLVWATLSATLAAAAQDAPYRLNPGDQLRVSIWREEGMDREMVVLPDGAVTFPLVGRLVVAGKTTADVEALIEAELSKTIRSARASVTITSVAGNRAFLLGNVRAPGSYVLSSQMTVAKLISVAGGLSEFARESRIVIVRETDAGPQRIRVNLAKLLDGDEDQSDYALQAGDLIIVP